MISEPGTGLQARRFPGTDRRFPSTDRRFPGTDRRFPGTDRRFPGRDLPVWSPLALVALGLPRTVLEDLGIVEPEGSVLHYALALTPFAVWLVVAVTRRSLRPLADFLVVGVLYGLSLVLVHQSLWDMGPSLGHHPPEGAVAFADKFDPSVRQLILRGYTAVVAMAIGVGTGLVVALTAVVAHRVRTWRNPNRKF